MAYIRLGPNEKRKPKRSLRSRLRDRKIEKWKSFIAYKNSEAYRTWASAVLIAAKRKCRRCKRPADRVWHLRWSDWGTEKLEDGMAVCRACYRDLVSESEHQGRQHRKIQQAALRLNEDLNRRIARDDAKEARRGEKRSRS